LFEPLGDQCLARGFGEAGADWQALGLHLGVPHAPPTLAEVSELGRDAFAARVLVAKIDQRSDHDRDAALLFQEHVAKLGETSPCLNRPVAVCGGQGVAQVLGRVEEIDDLVAGRQIVVQEGPVVVGAIRRFDQSQIGALGERDIQLSGEHLLERCLVRLRHPRHPHRSEALGFLVVEGQRRATHLAVPGWPLGDLAPRRRRGALFHGVAVLHRRQHTVEARHHGDGLVGYPRRQPSVPQPCRHHAAPPRSPRLEPSPTVFDFPGTRADLPAKVASRLGFLVSAS
jgi:hypothetical protein